MFNYMNRRHDKLFVCNRLKIDKIYKRSIIIILRNKKSYVQ
jgi:hypothetical protein